MTKSSWISAKNVGKKGQEKIGILTSWLGEVE
jgi:hypothetical protein